VEDAILGRFLSPDPLIQDPSNAQNYNRYSYVINNPLSYIDPTGFCNEGLGFDPCDGGGDNGGDSGGGGADPPPPEYGCGIPPFGPCYAPMPDVPNPTPSAPPAQAGGVGGSRGGGQPTPKAGNPSAPDFKGYLDCMTTSGASSGASSMADQLTEATDMMADTGASLDAFTKALASLNPNSLGSAIGPLSVPGPGFSVSPTNGTSAAFGQQASEFFQAAEPYAKYGGIFVAGAAVVVSGVQAYKQGGGYSGSAEAVSYASADAAIGYAAVSAFNVPGLIGSLAYNASGGTSNLVGGTKLLGVTQGCAAAYLGGLPAG
jgi:hypothetical protein